MRSPSRLGHAGRTAWTQSRNSLGVRVGPAGLCAAPLGQPVRAVPGEGAQQRRLVTLTGLRARMAPTRSGQSRPSGVGSSSVDQISAGQRPLHVLVAGEPPGGLARRRAPPQVVAQNGRGRNRPSAPLDARQDASARPPRRRPAGAATADSSPAEPAPSAGCRRRRRTRSPRLRRASRAPAPGQAPSPSPRRAPARSSADTIRCASLSVVFLMTSGASRAGTWSAMMTPWPYARISDSRLAKVSTA